ncbi:MAG: hypothetical protein QXD32_02685 [Nitrososphaerota archaeon]
MFQAYPGVSPVPAPVRKRPAGLIVLAILYIIGSIFGIVTGISAFASGATLLVSGYVFGGYYLAQSIIGLLVGILMLLGRAYTFILVWMIATLVIGLGIGGYIISELAPLADIPGFMALIGTIIGIIAVIVVIEVIIIYYLRRPHVKAFFGKAPPTPPIGPVGAPVGVAPPPPPPQPAVQAPLCPSCGAQLQYVPQYQKYWCPNEQRYV